MLRYDVVLVVRVILYNLYKSIAVAASPV